MTERWNSLRVLGTGLAVAAFFIGLLSAWLWMLSDARWAAHLARSHLAGQMLYATLTAESPAPAGVEVTPLAPADRRLAENGAFSQISGSPTPGFVTNVSIHEALARGVSGRALALAVVSDELRYPLADISDVRGQNPAGTLGALTRVLASYCSDLVVYARAGDGRWMRIEGSTVWGCGAAPSDLRLIAGIVAIVGLGIVITMFLNMTSYFERFAELLRSRRRQGGPESYESAGPKELRDIVSAVNSYLMAEREQLEKRALVLSGVSHDLGSPATRLRLRAALIDDQELRQRLEGDIDQMTGIIESVLTFTRAEVNSEEPQRLSLTALVDALVSNYSDAGRPVEFRRRQDLSATGGRSVFMSRQGRGEMSDERRVVVTGRPVALQRALSNLIDNALKYGRRAKVELEADADTATIFVEDEGVGYRPADLERLIAPYRRGENARTIQGFGLGLTIVASIANLHGGELSFETGARGLRACLKIQRQ